MVKKYFKIIIIVVGVFLASVPAHAATTAPATATTTATTTNSAGVPWFPLVPCGLNAQPAGIAKSVHDYTQTCNQCLLVELGKNIIDMTMFAIVPAVGTLLFMIAGFIILFSARSGNSGGVGKGKEIMTNTAIGIAIILSAWLITNFILKSLANPQVAQTPWYTIQCRVGSLKDLADATIPSVGGTTPSPTVATNYNCNAGSQCVALPSSQAGTYSGSTALSDCQEQCMGTTPTTGAVGYDCNDNSECVVDTNTSTQEYQDLPGCQSSCQGITAPPTGGPSGGTCLQSGLNLCAGNAPQGCFNSNCSQYATAANQYASGAATANILKAFMEVESSCNVNPPPGTGPSYGLMQLTPPIPQIYASRCGVSVSDVTSDWLKSPANAALSVCIAAQWINAVAASQCGSDIRNLYAGYNGGQGANGACGPSVDCSGNDCASQPVMRWECLYDDTAHQTCNGGNDINSGYNQTRQGATRAIACATNPGF